MRLVDISDHGLHLHDDAVYTLDVVAENPGMYHDFPHVTIIPCEPDCCDKYVIFDICPTCDDGSTRPIETYASMLCRGNSFNGTVADPHNIAEDERKFIILMLLQHMHRGIPDQPMSNKQFNQIVSEEIERGYDPLRLLAENDSK